MRVRFLVDGLNVYHSIKSAERHLQSGPLRWLNIHALCQTIVQSSFGPGHTLGGIHYFSALATHLEGRRPEVVRRHRTYIDALNATGVDVALATFKRKERLKTLAEMRVQVAPFRRWFRIPTHRVRLSYRTHEEKETDVAIACKLLELLAQDRCDAVVIVSGDTDIAPAIRTAKTLHPKAEVGVAFPFNRHNHELRKIGNRHLKISAQLYAGHQFQATVVTASGRVIRKPASW